MNEYMGKQNYYDNNSSNYEEEKDLDNFILETSSFNYFGKTDIGKVHTFNEDSIDGFSLLNDEVLCICAADGLGSVIGGQNSGVFVVQELKAYLKKFLISTDEEHIKYTLYNAFHLINKMVYNFKRISPNVYGSFISALSVCLITKDYKMILGHIGNTRIYVLREGELYQTTNDDTKANELVFSGKIAANEYASHPDRGVLTKFLGDGETDVYLDVSTLQKEDLILICSNGLYEMLTDEQIKEIINNNDNSKGACESLIFNANELGGIDNIAAVISYIDF